MYRLNRRNFMKLMGGGAVALGAGMNFPATSSAQTGGAVSGKTAEDEWEFYYPGQYNDEDAKVFQEFQVELDKINKANIKIDDLISGKLPRGTPGVGQATEITSKNMLEIAGQFVGNIPLFNDAGYAKKTKYGDLIAFPLISALEVMPAMFKTKGIADYMMVSSHNDTNKYYKPFYEGDKLYTLIDEQRFEDITPASGSRYRTFIMSGRARVFNQKGELVSEAANVLKESFRRRKDPEKRDPDGAHAWESPFWWSREPHMYTDKDWEYIKGMWKNEKVRGAETLYWDDVKIGDEPTPTLVGPVLTDEQRNNMSAIPQWCIDIRKNVLDPKTLSKMVKNKWGIYVLPEYLEKKPSGPKPEGGPPSDPAMSGSTSPIIWNNDGRAIFHNSVAAKCAAGMLCNWMGDAGWIQQIYWDIMSVPPGYPESVIPSIPVKLMPSLFDKYPYMEKVPYMKDKRAECHGMEGDVIISKAYVANKYQKDKEYLVDLVWWCETIEKDIIEEGLATIKLPKKA